jgi:RNA polymerase sigma-70 factor, ECF subfamily
VLREAFDYPYRQISKVLAISEANARQLAARAPPSRRRTTQAGQRRQHQRFLDAFVDAAQTGAVTKREGLAVDVVTSVPCMIAAQPWDGAPPDGRREWRDISCI